MALRPIFGSWPPHCWDVKTLEILGAEDVIRTPAPQPGGPGYLSFFAQTLFCMGGRVEFLELGV